VDHSGEAQLQPPEVRTAGGVTERCPRKRYDEEVKLTIDLDREEDGRWIAEALELPGVMCYGQTRDEAISNTERLAIEVIADRIANQELPSSTLNVSFTIADEQLARQ
jgi:predicted RNase H-like HicB family nuclease